MSYLGLITYLALKSKKFIPNRPLYFFAFITGSVFPDLYKFILYFQNIFNNTDFPNITHSLFSLTMIHLLFLAYHEIKKDESILNFAYGFSMGFILHIILDIILDLNGINIFWPIPIPEISLLSYFNNILIIKNYIISIEFIFFRLFAYQINQIILKNPNKNENNINDLNKFMKISTYFLITSVLVAIFLPHIHDTIYKLFYMISYGVSIYLLYRARDSFEERLSK